MAGGRTTRSATRALEGAPEDGATLPGPPTRASEDVSISDQSAATEQPQTKNPGGKAGKTAGARRGQARGAGQGGQRGKKRTAAPRAATPSSSDPVETATTPGSKRRKQQGGRDVSDRHDEMESVFMLDVVVGRQAPVTITSSDTNLPAQLKSALDKEPKTIEIRDRSDVNSSNFVDANAAWEQCGYTGVLSKLLEGSQHVKAVAVQALCALAGISTAMNMSVSHMIAWSELRLGPWTKIPSLDAACAAALKSSISDLQDSIGSQETLEHIVVVEAPFALARTIDPVHTQARHLRTLRLYPATSSPSTNVAALGGMRLALLGLGNWTSSREDNVDALEISVARPEDLRLATRSDARQIAERGSLKVMRLVFAASAEQDAACLRAAFEQFSYQVPSTASLELAPVSLSVATFMSLLDVLPLHVKELGIDLRAPRSGQPAAEELAKMVSTKWPGYYSLRETTGSPVTLRIIREEAQAARIDALFPSHTSEDPPRTPPSYPSFANDSPELPPLLLAPDAAEVTGTTDDRASPPLPTSLPPPFVPVLGPDGPQFRRPQGALPALSSALSLPPIQSAKFGSLRGNYSVNINPTSDRYLHRISGTDEIIMTGFSHADLQDALWPRGTAGGATSQFCEDLLAAFDDNLTRALEGAIADHPGVLRGKVIFDLQAGLGLRATKAVQAGAEVVYAKNSLAGAERIWNSEGVAASIRLESPSDDFDIVLSDWPIYLLAGDSALDQLIELFNGLAPTKAKQVAIVPDSCSMWIAFGTGPVEWKGLKKTMDTLPVSLKDDVQLRQQLALLTAAIRMAMWTLDLASGGKVISDVSFEDISRGGPGARRSSGPFTLEAESDRTVHAFVLFLRAGAHLGHDGEQTSVEMVKTSVTASSEADWLPTLWLAIPFEVKAGDTIVGSYTLTAPSKESRATIAVDYILPANEERTDNERMRQVWLV